MIVDDRNELVNGSAAANVGNAILGDVLDQGPLNKNDGTAVLRNLGVGRARFLVIEVRETFVGATATVQWQFVSDSAEALTTSRTVHIDTGAIPIASLTAGTRLVYRLPDQDTYERFLGIWQTVATANVTAGALRVSFAADVGRFAAYPDGVIS